MRNATMFVASKVIWWILNDPRCFSGDVRLGQQVAVGRAVPFVALHCACGLIVWVGVSTTAVLCACFFFVVRMFFITGFFHRYFSHRAFQANRAVQFLMAVLGCTAGQRGPLWWAGHHREHHAYADTEHDPHSPSRCGLLFSHMLWFLTPARFAVPEPRVADWLRFPELRWLERLDWLPFVLFAVGSWALGGWLESRAPEFGTNAPQMLVWCGVVSTVVLYHATYTINSLAHQFGKRQFPTADDSRNNMWLALLTLGEGWHNNHHFCPTAARQGFLWWQFDPTYAGLRLLAAVRLIRNLRPIPNRVLTAARESR